MFQILQRLLLRMSQNELISGLFIKCQEYDVQLVFVKKKFLDYILLTIHYTRNSRFHFLIRYIDDLEEVILYLELTILWP